MLEKAEPRGVAGGLWQGGVCTGEDEGEAVLYKRGENHTNGVHSFYERPILPVIHQPILAIAQYTT